MIMDKERNMNNNVDLKLWVPAETHKGFSTPYDFLVPVYESLPETPYPLTPKAFDVKLVLFGTLSKERRIVQFGVDLFREASVPGIGSLTRQWR